MDMYKYEMVWLVYQDMLFACMDQAILLPPPSGKCGTRSLPLADIYTQDMCSTNTFLQYIEKDCKCVPVSLPCFSK